MTQQTHIGKRRTSSWWEPSYNPSLEGHLVTSDWNFENHTGPQRSFLAAEGLQTRSQPGEVYKLVGLTFSECDIQGIFDHRPSILFDKCRFRSCDFAFSEWNRTTFRNCEFENCSISLSTFKDCEFRDCNWTRIGFSGSKTDFNRTFITNPKSLIFAGYSGVNSQILPAKKHAAYQAYRLEATKAHLSRNILLSHETTGDDNAYYEAARLNDLLQAKSRIKAGWYSVRYDAGRKRMLDLILLPGWILEVVMLSLIGSINGWGARLLRPILILAFSIAIFAFVYASEGSVSQPLQKAFDIGVLAGYTNQSSSQQSEFLRSLEGLQLVISIVIYTVFFATVVARLSRSR